MNFFGIIFKAFRRDLSVLTSREEWIEKSMTRNEAADLAASMGFELQ